MFGRESKDGVQQQQQRLLSFRSVHHPKVETTSASDTHEIRSNVSDRAPLQVDPAEPLVAFA